jgi:hypothetical protein
VLDSKLESHDDIENETVHENGRGKFSVVWLNILFTERCMILS